MLLISLHEQHLNLVGRAVAIRKLEGILVRLSTFEVRVSAVLQKELNHAQVYLEGLRVHAHRYTTKVHQECTVCAYLIDVGSIGEKYFRYAKA